MEKLNRNLLTNGFKFNDDLKIGTTDTMPEKVIQFGEGNFLRAFVDYMFDELNAAGKFGGSITLIQPIEFGPITQFINEQEGLYTLLARGLEQGKEVCNKRLITSTTRCLNPYADFETYSNCAKNPELRFVVSNTTESGIVYNKEDMVSDQPQKSFPAKVTNFLYERFKAFDGAKDKGLVFIPCELIDDNGKTLKKYVLQHAADWNLGQDFISWVENDNIFTSTLVDRIVTGYPRDNAKELCEEFGYEDNLINTSEIFHFWVIEGPAELSKELPFDQIGLNVLFTPDAKPYKKRKVRILNGAHTCSVLGAFLAGKDTVGELMADKKFYTYLEKALNEEVIPTLIAEGLDMQDLKFFADAVFDRFQNPYIKHMLLNIALNSTSKFRARVLPSITSYINEKKELPKILTFSFAALLAFYRGNEIKDGALIGTRNGETYEIKDDADVLELFLNLWADTNTSDKASVAKLVSTVCANDKMWGEDLNQLAGFADKVTDHLYAILNDGVEAELDNLLA